MPKKKVVCVTTEDHAFIEELYKRITETYKQQAARAGIKPTTGKKGKGPKVRHVVAFLREHAVYTDKEIQEFVARFIK